MGYLKKWTKEIRKYRANNIEIISESIDDFMLELKKRIRKYPEFVFNKAELDYTESELRKHPLKENHYYYIKKEGNIMFNKIRHIIALVRMVSREA